MYIDEVNRRLQKCNLSQVPVYSKYSCQFSNESYGCLELLSKTTQFVCYGQDVRACEGFVEKTSNIDK